ncbi:hypothetical protein AB4084_41690, partial [Lysobacter sp. 2RAB21]
SSDYNRTYFNPLVTYRRWRKPNADGKGGFTDYPQAVPAAALLDPDRPDKGSVNLTQNYIPPDVVSNFWGYFTFARGMR